MENIENPNPNKKPEISRTGMIAFMVLIYSLSAVCLSYGIHSLVTEGFFTGNVVLTLLFGVGPAFIGIYVWLIYRKGQNLDMGNYPNFTIFQKSLAILFTVICAVIMFIGYVIFLTFIKFVLPSPFQYIADALFIAFNLLLILPEILGYITKNKDSEFIEPFIGIQISVKVKGDTFMSFVLGMVSLTFYTLYRMLEYFGLLVR
ncbi:MAG: hypothetical protein WC980_05110 [Candidatus Brocadiia bacterium]